MFTSFKLDRVRKVDGVAVRRSGIVGSTKEDGEICEGEDGGEEKYRRWLREGLR